MKEISMNERGSYNDEASQGIGISYQREVTKQ